MSSRDREADDWFRRFTGAEEGSVQVDAEASLMNLMKCEGKWKGCLKKQFKM